MPAIIIVYYIFYSTKCEGIAYRAYRPPILYTINNKIGISLGLFLYFILKITNQLGVKKCVPTFICKFPLVEIPTILVEVLSSFCFSHFLLLMLNVFYYL